jgi:microcystin-dependent protein
MDIKDIILFILIIVNIYLFYNTKKRENFNTTDNIKNAINDKYKFDLQSMRELSDFATLIRKEYDTYVLPTNITFAKDLINEEDLIVHGDVEFTNKDNSNNIFNIFPRYSIVAWANEDIPKGWAKCTGNYYVLNEEGIAISTYDNNNPNKILTPDLRSRFIKSVASNGYSGSLINKEYVLGQIYGEQTHKLTLDEIPKHSHKYQVGWSYNYGSANFKNAYNTNELIPYGYLGGDNKAHHAIFTSKIGGNEKHNNMPPYYALYYIMKL